MVAATKNPNKQQNKNNSPTSKKIKPGLLIIIIGIVPAILYFLFFMNSNDTPQHLKGIWIRTDGGYKIEIKEVQDDGKLDAAYFNPNPINVGRSEWRIQDGVIQVYVELQDENYPGSIYQLTYDEDAETLRGTYFQAVAQQTFEVYFTREK
ncbi:MAG: hypothetical protein K8R74_15455 [Bacteroidales bacterium]|nr:hypothetical protein [Bacteroidales bacterium]